MYEKSLQQLSKLPDFDQICDFENYFPQGNFSTVLTLSIQRVDRRPSSSKKPKRRPSRATLASRLDHCTQQFPEVKIEIKKWLYWEFGQYFDKSKHEHKFGI
jgi:hypothetical protein